MPVTPSAHPAAPEEEPEKSVVEQPPTPALAVVEAVLVDVTVTVADTVGEAVALAPSDGDAEAVGDALATLPPHEIWRMMLFPAGSKGGGGA